MVSDSSYQLPHWDVSSIGANQPPVRTCNGSDLARIPPAGWEAHGGDDIVIRIIAPTRDLGSLHGLDAWVAWRGSEYTLAKLSIKGRGVRHVLPHSRPAQPRSCRLPFPAKRHHRLTSTSITASFSLLKSAPSATPSGP